MSVSQNDSTAIKHVFNHSKKNRLLSGFIILGISFQVLGDQFKDHHFSLGILNSFYIRHKTCICLVKLRKYGVIKLVASQCSSSK